MAEQRHPSEATPAPRALVSVPTPAAPLPSGRLYYRRIWLNRPGHHAGGHVLCNVDLERGKEADTDLWISASFSLADCSRSATLDFDLGSGSSPAERRNGLRKARLLRESVLAFCDAIEIAYAEQEAAAAALRARHRKRERRSRH